MIKVAVFAGGQLADFSTGFDVYVGVDRGSLFLIENQLPLDLAVGDFDSVSQDELQLIKKTAKAFVQACPEKDDTDTELALKKVFEQYPKAQVTIFGAFGGRIDHMMSNLFLPGDVDIAPFMRQIILRDKQNSVQFYPAGTCHVMPEDGMTYVSFMADGDADLAISGAKYNLDASNFFKKKIYSSNEFLDQQPITVTLDSGYLIVIQSKDR
ncbi:MULTISPECIES: thiamine diphosphokinase [Streptococcus]|jgi:thiamine pyrophosphokinase|uniref:Thiamine diphosphokinase n=1 Tax=Streptococcus equinus TaxID=1335 RepID=A0A1G9NQP6_STREI|nr:MULTISPECIES: thiamine diphosphokinase [Streptococcus]KEY47235.1 thiamine pyrophosphokinase [Streptococcus equinus]KFN86702.1 thiamine pyrophosphokinase [Streptococcus equinus ATCC 33317]MDO4886608.1 thiamine diphosphokinase [Streptococcus sp.]MEE0949425.1 thiamine diphosphokinase [Streptococcus equinus]QGX45954.1 thiamine diphosphokinase [Streptococcus equinus]